MADWWQKVAQFFTFPLSLCCLQYVVLQQLKPRSGIYILSPWSGWPCDTFWPIKHNTSNSVLIPNLASRCFACFCSLRPLLPWEKNEGKVSGGKDTMWRNTQVSQTTTSQLSKTDPPNQPRTNRRLMREHSWELPS